MPLQKAIMDRESRPRKSNVQASKTAEQLAKEEAEYYKQREKRMAERKAAMERIKKQQEVKTARGGVLGALSGKSDGNSKGGVLAALQDSDVSDNVAGSRTGGHSRASDSAGSHSQFGNTNTNGSSGISAMFAGIAGDNERKTGTSGHNRTGDITGSHQGVGSSVASGSSRTSRHPDDIYNPGVNENGSYRAPAAIPDGIKPNSNGGYTDSGTGSDSKLRLNMYLKANLNYQYEILERYLGSKEAAKHAIETYTWEELIKIIKDANAFLLGKDLNNDTYLLQNETYKNAIDAMKPDINDSPLYVKSNLLLEEMGLTEDLKWLVYYFNNDEKKLEDV